MERRPGWNYWKAGELIESGVLEIGDGYRAKNSEMGTPGIPFARAGNVNGGFRFEEADMLSEESVRRAGEKVSQSGDVTFTSKGTFGRFAYVRPETPRFVYSPQLCYWRLKHERLILRRFLYYWMQGSDCMNQLVQIKSLTDMADYVSLSNQRKMWLSAPSVQTQRKIAGILSAYDDLIENNIRQIRILEEMAQAIYREWFVHFRFPGHEKVKMVDSSLGKIPERWEAVTLRDVTRYINRGISPIYDDNSDTLVLNQRCIRDGKINPEFSRKQSKQVPQEKFVQFGDVLINSTGVGTLGRVAQLYETVENCTVDSHVTIARANKRVNLDYFGFHLLGLQNRFEHSGTGTTGQTELNRETIANCDFLIPSMDLQNSFSDTVSGMRQSIAIMTRANSNLSATRDLLLPRLISGEVDVIKLDAEEVTTPA